MLSLCTLAIQAPVWHDCSSLDHCCMLTCGPMSARWLFHNKSIYVSAHPAMVEVKIIQDISIKYGEAAPVRIPADLVVEELWQFHAMCLSLLLKPFVQHCLHKALTNPEPTMFGQAITSGQCWH